MVTQIFKLGEKIAGKNRHTEHCSSTVGFVFLPTGEVLPTELVTRERKE